MKRMSRAQRLGRNLRPGEKQIVEKVLTLLAQRKKDMKEFGYWTGPPLTEEEHRLFELLKY